MSWKFVPSDVFDLEQLYEFQKFYQDDLTRAEGSLNQLQAMESAIMRGKNGAKIMTNAHNHVKQSKWNFQKVAEAIEIAKKRQL